MYPAHAVHAAPAPAVEYIFLELKQSNQVGGTQPGHRAVGVRVHVFCFFFFESKQCFELLALLIHLCLR